LAGSGKSELAKALADLGAAVIDVDKIGHACLKDELIKKEVVKVFGIEILDGEGEIMRPALGRLVFADEQSIAKLNAVMHPPMVQRVEKLLREMEENKRTDAVVIDAALLFQMGLQSFCNIIVFVDCPADIRAKRLQSARRLTDVNTQRLDRLQRETEKNRREAHHIFQNSGGREDIRGFARSLLAR
jgi:dephospho-CoA kinase